MQKARQLERTHPVAAADLAATASSVAWLNHTGSFSWPGIEQLCLDLAVRELGHHPASRAPLACRAPVAGKGGTVVHVLSQAYDTGGHTRLVWRWITADTDRHHRVVLTDHGRAPIPVLLRDALGPDDLWLLRKGPDGLLGVAAQLADACAGTDLVVVHHHPNDVTPLLAFGGRPQRPPVAVLNHAEHWYWSGTAIADVVICYEEKGARICRERRGIDAARLALLPLPLDIRPMADKAAAKKALGIDPETVVFLTVARPGKYEAVGQPHLAEVLGPFVAAHPGALVLAVGPSDGGPWERARQASGGRIRAVGTQHPLEPWIDAADVALESYPLGSTTALLEAVMAGAVPVTFRFDPDVVALFTSDSFGTAHVLVDTVADVASTLGALVTDRELRVSLAQRCRADVLRTHGEAGFRSALNDIYVRADLSTPVSAPAPHDRRSAGPDRFLVRQLLAEGSAVTADALDAVLAHVEALAPLPDTTVVLLCRGGAGRAALAAELEGSTVECFAVDPRPIPAPSDGDTSQRDTSNRDMHPFLDATVVGDVNTAVARSRGRRLLIVADDLTGDAGWFGALAEEMDADPTVLALLPAVDGVRDGNVCSFVRGVPARAGWTLPLAESTVGLHTAPARRWTSFLLVPHWDGGLADTVTTYLRAFSGTDPVTLVIADTSGADIAQQVASLEEIIAGAGGSAGADLVLSRLDREPADNGRGRLVWLGAPEDPRRPAGAVALEGPLDVDNLRRHAA